MGREEEKQFGREMWILVVGGRLQGTEIVYLAKKAGHKVFLIDRQEDVPAAGLADYFLVADIYDREKVYSVFQCVDYVIPAIENIAVLKRIEKYCKETGAICLFDIAAYSISSSKTKTNRLLKTLGIRIPEPFPACGYPVICKPDSESGSRGVRKINSEEEKKALGMEQNGECVVQQYLEGPVYSLEVLGDGRDAVFPMVTEVVIDREYDCKRILAPAAADETVYEEFTEIAARINGAIKIRGIFDIEAVLHEGHLYVLEIDARFPSQTPISIYHASGINFVEVLLAYEGVQEIPEPDRKCACILHQIEVTGNRLLVCGEHTMTDAGRLHVIEGLCGADEMITNYSEGAYAWKAMVILTGKDIEEAAEKWNQCIQKIADLQKCGTMQYIEG